jgi:ABC-type Mn2+/Zn2+ transport system permease subunit
MSIVHMRSFWLGAHGTLLVIALLLLPISWAFLFTASLSGLCVWANWTAMQEEYAKEAV